jgi:4a-hydroxytetrahydrobiopterin dehydratase
MNLLTTKKCQACSIETPILASDEIKKFLSHIHKDWQLNESQTEISRTFDFKNYGQVMAFTNSVAWLAFKEGHHPDMEISYNRCIVHYTTHAIKALSDNDFICAAKVDYLFEI